MGVFSCSKAIYEPRDKLRRPLFLLFGTQVRRESFCMPRGRRGEGSLRGMALFFRVSALIHCSDGR